MRILVAKLLLSLEDSKESSTFRLSSNLGKSGVSVSEITGGTISELL